MLGEHIGVLTSLGIVSVHDRDPHHYFVLKHKGDTSVVNIDPDFMVWVPRLSGNEEFREQYEALDPHDTDDSREYEPLDDLERFFSSEDEASARVDWGPKAEDFRRVYIEDELDFRDCHHSIAGRIDESDPNEQKYLFAKAKQLFSGESVSRDFLERINEHLYATQ